MIAYTDKSANEVAAEWVFQLKKDCRGNSLKVAAVIQKERLSMAFGDSVTPSTENVFRLRVAELALALNKITDLYSDGNRKYLIALKEDVNPTALSEYRTLKMSGLQPAGGLCLSQRFALSHGMSDLLAPNLALEDAATQDGRNELMAAVVEYLARLAEEPIPVQEMSHP